MKIPATVPGLAAIEDCIAKGKSINVTLIFSLERYAAVVEAYIRGLERLVAGGGDPTNVASVASFFVSRVDTEADRRLDEIGGQATRLQGKLAIANAKLAYRHWQEAFAGPRWEFLAAKGAKPQRCLWASTSTKNPEYRDVMYVEELIGPETVNTMPRGDDRRLPGSRQGRADTLTEGVAEARRAARAAGGGRRRLRRRRRDARGARACRSSPTRSRSCSTGSARSGPSSPPRDRLRRSSSGSGRTTRRSGPTRARTAGSAGSTSSRGPRPRRRAERVRGGRDRAVPRLRPARHGRLLARAGGAAADVRRRVVPRPRHDAPGGDPRGSSGASTWSRRSSSPPRSRARRSRRARTSTTSGSGPAAAAAQFAAITDPGSELERPRARARLPRRLRGRAGDRRPLLGALDVRDRAGGADGRRPRAASSRSPPTMTVACQARGRQPRPRARPRSSARAGGEGRDKVCIDESPTGFGLWAEQLLAESTGKQGKGLVPAPGESPDGPDRAARASCDLVDPLRARGRVLPLGVRDRRRGARARDQPVRPARRAGREGQDERGAGGGTSRTSSRAGSLDELLAQAQAGRDYVCIQAFVDPAREDELAPLVARGARDRLRRHERARPALPALDRPAAQGRPEHRALRPGRRRDRRRAADPRPRLRLRAPDPRAGGRRPRRARGARTARRALRLEDI